MSPGQDINNPLASIPSVFTVHNKTKSNYKSPPRGAKGTFLLEIGIKKKKARVSKTFTENLANRDVNISGTAFD